MTIFVIGFVCGIAATMPRRSSGPRWDRRRAGAIAAYGSHEAVARTSPP